jgi:hypothetical protein
VAFRREREETEETEIFEGKARNSSGDGAALFGEDLSTPLKPLRVGSFASVLSVTSSSTAWFRLKSSSPDELSM